MKPGGKFHMSDLDRVGGVPMVLKHLLDAGLLHGDVHDRAPAGRWPRTSPSIDPPRPDGVVVHPLDQPIHTEGGINVLTGSLAPKGAVVKVAGLTDGAEAVRGPGPRVRRRGRRDGRRSSPATIAAGHRHRDPLRGTEGRTGDARDARHHRRAEGRRARRRLRADHRRPLLRRHVGVLHRPRGARGDRRRTDRVRARRRPDPHRRADASRSTCWSTTPSWPRAARAGRPTRRATPTACSASTPGSCRAPRPAPSRAT